MRSQFRDFGAVCDMSCIKDDKPDHVFISCTIPCLQNHRRRGHDPRSERGSKSEQRHLLLQRERYGSKEFSGSQHDMWSLQVCLPCVWVGTRLTFGLGTTPPTQPAPTITLVCTLILLSCVLPLRNLARQAIAPSFARVRSSRTRQPLTCET